MTPAATPPTNQNEPPKTPEPPKDPSLLNKAPEGAPEKYADFKLPEGMKFDQAGLEKATAIFKELNLPQDGAQRLVDLQAEQIKQLMDNPVNAVIAQKTEWEDAAKQKYGKEIEPGGKVNLSIARLIDRFPEEMRVPFRQGMDNTLAGSHPAFIAAMNWISEQFGEGTTVKGNGPSPLGQKGPDAPPRSVAQNMYPHLPSVNTQS